MEERDVLAAATGEPLIEAAELVPEPAADRERADPDAAHHPISVLRLRLRPGEDAVGALVARVAELVIAGHVPAGLERELERVHRLALLAEEDVCVGEDRRIPLAGKVGGEVP